MPTIHRIGVIGAGAWGTARITSYNVCYTKLLRGIAHLDDETGRVVDDILQRHFHLDDVLVLGEHDLLQRRRPDLGGIDGDDLVHQRSYNFV